MIAWTENDGEMMYTVVDGAGTPMMTLDSSNNVVASYEYSPMGENLTASSNQETPPVDFAGGIKDEELDGVVFFGAGGMAYDTDLGIAYNGHSYAYYFMAGIGDYFASGGARDAVTGYGKNIGKGFTGFFTSIPGLVKEGFIRQGKMFTNPIGLISGDVAKLHYLGQRTGDFYYNDFLTGRFSKWVGENPREWGSGVAGITGNVEAFVFAGGITKLAAVRIAGRLQKVPNAIRIADENIYNLPAFVERTFEKGNYVTRILEEDILVYRAEGIRFGRWFGLEKPASAMEAEQLYNIIDYVDSDLAEVSTYIIPKGTIVYEGPVAGGKGIQIFIHNIRKSGVRLLKTEPLPQAGF